MTAALPSTLPDGALATAPAEARGLARDGVRLLVAGPDGLRHRTAATLAGALRAGDLLVVNTSDTLPAALTGVTADGERVEAHLSTLEPGGDYRYPAALRATASRWVVEVRTGPRWPAGPLGGEPSQADRTGARIRLAGGGALDVLAPTASRRLWSAELRTPAPLLAWLTEHGDPIRYRYVSARWPLSAYRTPYADTPGSAEMPSAGRALTPRVLRRLAGRGVRVAGLVLHTGVSSLDPGDGPHPEWFEVPASTAEAVAATRAEGGRVVAVGTTVVRALESAGGRAASGWTDLVITPARGAPTVDGLLTGWHEPAASHLLMLEAIAGRALLAESYAEALAHGYRWHEFGDLHLILPR
ncbi:S-adenosylmethionine:tRNA ribosyltransferase-isomerase [Pseudonocardia acaciae]|uniref:S-adenosylmethionine:tRNA ribosyltransferase-isomerase n=1 Tax=Pseudonocardia acaciae TaxID=551276 RepID=UPI00048EECDE|nr:S-adenosylmethionine:tRNA ribosyltransferase-isomerase [Pseudonocardia acaciae]